MEKSKIALLVVAIVVALGCLGLMGLQAFCDKIYESRDCDFANIDNIEMRTSIDIPEIHACDCRYDEREFAKKVTFIIDKKSLDLDDYITKHGFTKFPEDQQLHNSMAFAGLKSADRAQLFYRSNESMRTSGRSLYRMALNPQTGKMWVYLRYD